MSEIAIIISKIWKEIFSVQMPFLGVSFGAFWVGIAFAYILLRGVVGLFTGHIGNRDSSVGTSERMRHKK